MKFLLAVDAIHPNNNPEYINVGLEYSALDMLFIRMGKSHTFYNLDNGTEDGLAPEHGLSLGAGIKYRIPRGPLLNIDYVYTQFGVFKNVEGYSISLTF